MELELLISGLQNIDIDDLRENTVYDSYTATSKPVQYLFEAL
jgi:E3 ubiquitin-protein ligase HUWE1